MRRRIPNVSLAAIAAVAICFYSSIAAADHQPQSAEIYFDELAVALEGNDLLVDYAIHSEDWDRLGELELTPLLEVQLPEDATDRAGDFSRELMLTQRTGRFTLEFPGDLHRADRIHVRPIRDYDLAKGGTVELGGDFSSTYEFPLTSGFAEFTGSDRYAEHHDGHDCQRTHGEESSNGQATDNRRRSWSGWTDWGARYDRHQRRRARRQRTRGNSASRADVIAVCSQETNFDRDRQHCVERSTDLQTYDAADVIRACGDATSFSSTFRTCLDRAVDLSAAPAATIRACGDVTDFGSHFTACIESASTYDRDPSGIVRACGESANFSNRIPGCVERG